MFAPYEVPPHISEHSPVMQNQAISCHLPYREFLRVSGCQTRSSDLSFANHKAVFHFDNPILGMDSVNFNGIFFNVV